MGDVIAWATSINALASVVMAISAIVAISKLDVGKFLLKFGGNKLTRTDKMSLFTTIIESDLAEHVVNKMFTKSLIDHVINPDPEIENIIPESDD